MVGSCKRLDWPSLSLAMDEILLQLEIDEIWLEDLYPKIIDRYQKISGHNVINRNKDSLKEVGQLRKEESALFLV